MKWKRTALAVCLVSVSLPSTSIKEKTMLRKFCFLAIALLFFFSFPLLSKATDDPVLKTINEAVTHYKNGKFSSAVTSLEYASQMIRQKKGEALGKLLPEPLSGWTAKQADNKAMGSAMFGGAITAERQYVKGNSAITVRFSTDSPMMQSMLMMFSNPIFVSSAGKLELIKGKKAIVDYKDAAGTVNIVIDNKVLITVEGNNVKREDLIAYAAKIDMDRLAKLP
jgi:hypothetical protein